MLGRPHFFLKYPPIIFEVQKKLGYFFKFLWPSLSTYMNFKIACILIRFFIICIEEGKWNVYKFIWQPKLKSYINQVTKKHRQGLKFIGQKELTLIVIHTFPSYSIFRIFVHHWQFNKTERRLRLLYLNFSSFVIYIYE